MAIDPLPYESLFLIFYSNPNVGTSFCISKPNVFRSNFLVMVFDETAISLDTTLLLMTPYIVTVLTLYSVDALIMKKSNMY